ncbi:MAG: 1-acyl-sn-glycerol-3-phosphate acyltransferase [candidate division Zixibacteria bacterium]
MRIIFGVNIIGKENLDKLEQFIIIANHNSHLDIALLYFLLPIGYIARTHPVADLPHFSKFRIVFSLVSFFFKPIWVTRGKPDIEDDPFGDIKSALSLGHNVIIFPEGTRGEPGELQHFKSGIGRLMTQCPDIPIVPVFITGPERALPRKSALILPIWNSLIVGPPQKCTGEHRQITKRLENVIIELANSESARRHKRRPHERKRPKQVAFLGIDGSGKSTISSSVAKSLSVESRVGLVSDELRFFEHGESEHLQPLATEKIRHAIGGYSKKAKSLKFYKIPKLTELLLRDQLLGMVRRWYSPDLVVMDGSPLLNLLAWSSLYKGDIMDNAVCSKIIGIVSGRVRETKRDDPIYALFPELAHLKRLGLAKLSLPDIVVLIDIKPETACGRIDSRGEHKQVHETVDKLSRLRDAYLRVCDVIREDWNVPTLIIDGEQSKTDVATAGYEFVNKTPGVEA